MQPRIDSLETRRLFAFVPTGASTVNGDEYQSIDRTLALDGGGYVSAGIFGEDTDFGTGKVYQPKGDSDVFLALVRDGKTSLFTIGGSSSQDLDTDDDRADFDADPARIGDDFPFGVDSRIRGADEYVSQMKVGPDGKLYVAMLFRRTISLNTQNKRAMMLTASDEFAGNYTDSVILRYDISGSKLVFEDSMQLGGPFNDFIYDFDFSSSGDLVVVGSYERRTDFDPSEDGTKFQEPDGRGDGFVAKYTKNFELLWVDNFGGDAGEEERPDAVYSVAVDTADNDAIYIGGAFARTADFNPAAGKANRLLIKSEGATDGYTMKLDTSGNGLWVRVQGGDGYDAVKRVTLAPGGVYNVGYFSDEAKLDLTNDEREFEINDDEDGDTDLFFTRLQADGDQLYVEQIAGNGYELVADAATTSGGDLLIAGSYYGTVDLDPTSRRVVRSSPDADGREDSNVGERDFAYAGFVAVYGKSNARLRRSAQVNGQGDEDVFITGMTQSSTGAISVAGRYRAGFNVPGTKLAVGTKRDVDDEREDGYTFFFNGDLTPIV